jgi:hypothetical protein
MMVVVGMEAVVVVFRVVVVVIPLFSFSLVVLLVLMFFVDLVDVVAMVISSFHYMWRINVVAPYILYGQKRFTGFYHPLPILVIPGRSDDLPGEGSTRVLDPLPQ